MSNPRNPLDYFRSYSYHHILVACDGTDTAEALAKQSEITLFDHEGADTKYCPRTAPGAGRYVVLINGMSDAQLTIKSAKWSCVLVPKDSPRGESQVTSMSVDGELVIHEIFGVNFLNLVNDTTKRLGTDATGVIFLLKTIFVGHQDDGTTTTISNIEPLLFFAYDISAIFDITGAEYILSFAGVVNGASKTTHVSAITDGFDFTVQNTGASTNTLSNVIEVQLKKTINDYYSNMRNAVVEDQRKTNPDYDFDGEFLNVEYSFELDPVYREKHYVVDNTPPSVQNTGNGDPTLTLRGDSMSMERMLDLIMQSCTAVMNEESEDAKKRYMHKITSTLKTSPSKYEVIYQIHRYEAVLVPAEDIFSFTPPENEGIIFDYIFTGQNVDIKTFDVKMQMGMVFFQMLNAASSVPGHVNDVSTQSTPESRVVGAGNPNGSGDQKLGSGCSGDSPLVRKKPLFLGQKVKDSSLRNNRSPQTTVNYNSLLARHAALENIVARMVIRGNPQLLAETTQFPSHVRVSSPELPTEVKTFPDGRRYFPPIHQFPAHVKVNVFMPTQWMVSEPGNPMNADYAQNFWYPGWYNLLQIDHVFEDGEFTQELEMYSIPTDTPLRDLNVNVKQKNTTQPTNKKANIGGKNADEQTVGEKGNQSKGEQQ